MRQHVISEWLLKGFASETPGGLALAAYDKTRGVIRTFTPGRFMTAIDDHSAEVEVALGRIEGHAAAATQRLLDRVQQVREGLYPLTGLVDHHGDPELREATDRALHGMRLFTTDTTLAEPTVEDRRAVAEYLGLMFTRAPKMERGINRAAGALRRGFEQMVRAEAPGILASLSIAWEDAIADARFIGLRTPEAQTKAFASMDWWVLRAGPSEEFVLGDSPVVATLQLGHEADSWRPLISNETYAVCMPLNRTVALIVATQRLIPVGVEMDRMVQAINRLSWRWADRFVAGANPDMLEAARAGVPDPDQSVEVDISLEKAFGQGLLTGWKVIESEWRSRSRPCQPLSLRSFRHNLHYRKRHGM